MNENKCAICGEVIPKDWTLCTPCQRREIKIGMIMQSYGTEQDENKENKKNTKH